MNSIELASEDAVRAVGSRAATWQGVSKDERIAMRSELRIRLDMTMVDVLCDALAGAGEERLGELMLAAETVRTRRDETIAWGAVGCHVMRLAVDWLDSYLRAAYGPAETESERDARERREAIARCAAR